jgi:hypothetical protein
LAGHYGFYDDLNGFRIDSADNLGSHSDNSDYRLYVNGTANLKSLILGEKDITSTYSLLQNDYTVNATSGTFTVTLPDVTGISAVGHIYYISNSGTGTITIATTSSQTFQNVTGTPTTLTLGTKGVYGLQATATGWVTLSTNTTSGVYTPTLTAVTNISADTAYQFTYSRNGNVVTYAGSIKVVTTAALASEVDFSLPIPSNFATDNDLNGTGSAKTAIATNVVNEGDAVNDRGECEFIGLAISGSGIIFISGQYVIK